jgi:hypothetical protein
LFYDLLGGPGGRVEFSATVLVMLLGNISSLSKNPVKLDKIGYDDVLPAFRLLINNKALLVRPPAGGVMCRSVSGCVRNAGELVPRWHVASLAAIVLRRHLSLGDCLQHSFFSNNNSSWFSFLSLSLL